jgi:hypothetical protein
VLPLILQWRGEIFLLMFAIKHVDYPEQDQDDKSRDALLLEQDRHETSLPSAPSPQNVMQDCPLPDKVCH